jgi:cyclopropane fatty-acyl-phospholipid synthase-like methyltransferase
MSLSSPSPRRPDIGYIPSPPEVVQTMLELASIQPNDVLYDLGCGDGRIVIAAAQQFGIRAVGIDINPDRVREAQALAEAAGVGDRVTFRQGDLFTSTVEDATVVTLYLLPHLNTRLLPHLRQQLKPGTRIVSHDFDMEKQWEPQQSVRLSNEEESTVFVWILPG